MRNRAFRGFLVIAGVGIVAVLVVPGGRGREYRCQENLVRIDGAKEVWAFDNDRKDGDIPLLRDLMPEEGSGYLKEFPICPSGGRYTIGPIGMDPTCDSGLPGHSLHES